MAGSEKPEWIFLLQDKETLIITEQEFS